MDVADESIGTSLVQHYWAERSSELLSIHDDSEAVLSKIEIHYRAGIAILNCVIMIAPQSLTTQAIKCPS